MDTSLFWTDDFERFCQRFDPHFQRSETREQVRAYLRGLLAPDTRKAILQSAAADEHHDLHRLLNHAHWNADAVRDELQRFVVERLGHPNAIGVLDETGFAKKGDRSVGVQRQWCLPLPYRANCQIGLFLAYVSPHGTAFLDRCLYLPEAWCKDAQRRQAAKVPEQIRYMARPELGMGMLEHACRLGVPMRWIVGDEQYGDVRKVREDLASLGLQYVLAVSPHLSGWRERPEGRGRPNIATSPSLTVARIVQQWPEDRWATLDVETGADAPEPADWAYGSIVAAPKGSPDEAIWIVARRARSEPQVTTYYLSNAPGDIALSTLARVVAARSAVIQRLQECREQAGLDRYEVRCWPSWHRHITLSLAAYAWLVSISGSRLSADPYVDERSISGLVGDK